MWIVPINSHRETKAEQEYNRLVSKEKIIESGRERIASHKGGIVSINSYGRSQENNKIEDRILVMFDPINKRQEE